MSLGDRLLLMVAEKAHEQTSGLSVAHKSSHNGWVPWVTWGRGAVALPDLPPGLPLLLQEEEVATAAAWQLQQEGSAWHSSQDAPLFPRAKLEGKTDSL